MTATRLPSRAACRRAWTRSRYCAASPLTLIGGERGHIGSTMSLIEILRVLYDSVLSYRPDEPDWPRDRCVLSKAMAVWRSTPCSPRGFSKPPPDRFLPPPFLSRRPSRARRVPGVASTGALGHGLSLGVGMALAQRMRGRRRAFPSWAMAKSTLPGGSGDERGQTPARQPGRDCRLQQNPPAGPTAVIKNWSHWPTNGGLRL